MFTYESYKAMKTANSNSQVSCVLLSAGSSQRMGCHKALLPYDEDTNFIQKIAGVYLKSEFEQVVVVVSNELNEILFSTPQPLLLSENITFVINDKPELGRFYSLQTGIKLIPPGNFCFFQNIDNPFTSVELLDTLIQQKELADVIIPVSGNNSGHPVVISPSVTAAILTQSDPEIRIDDFLKKFNVLLAETGDNRILTNINLPSEYRAAGF